MIIVREKDTRKRHRIIMRERRSKMKVVFDAYVLELVKNLPIDGYLFSDCAYDGLWYVNAGKPFVRQLSFELGETVLFTIADYKTIRFIDVHGFGRMTALPVEMCIERGLCRD